MGLYTLTGETDVKTLKIPWIALEDGLSREACELVKTNKIRADLSSPYQEPAPDGSKFIGKGPDGRLKAHYTTYRCAKERPGA